MTEVVIAAAARTPVGAFLGGLSSLPAHTLGETVIVEALKRAEVDPEDVSEVIMGQILSAGEGQNPARQAAVGAGIPVEKTAYGINQLCGSGLRSVALGFQAIKVGDSSIVVAGGQENMSQAPHCVYLRDGTKMGSTEMVDTMIKDGLWDAFNGYHMGTTAENIAEKWQLTRDEQDAFAAHSQAKAEDAQKAGKFADEIVPVIIKTRKGETVVDTDEYPKHGTTAESLGKLRAAFAKDGTVTAGNASGVNDGAAAMLVASEAAVKQHGLKPMAKIIGMATAGVEPRIMGYGPVPAVQKLLKRTGIAIDDIDVFEFNEAFAAQALACMRDLGLADDDPRVNPNGGAIALGHPLGMSGARLLLTAAHELQNSGKRYALCTMCVGVGQGIATLIERV